MTTSPCNRAATTTGAARYIRLRAPPSNPGRPFIRAFTVS